MDDLFAPPGPAWTRVSPRLATIRRVVLLVVLAPVVVAVPVGGLLLELPLWLVGALIAAVLAGGAWGWWLIGRNRTRWGYAEADEELYITRGALFRRLVVVPYGRMQYVDINAGPVEQLNGIASLRLHTASPGTSAVIPGLPSQEAARLRDRLTAMGENRAAGL